MTPFSLKSTLRKCRMGLSENAYFSLVTAWNEVGWTSRCIINVL